MLNSFPKPLPFNTRQPPCWADGCPAADDDCWGGRCFHWWALVWCWFQALGDRLDLRGREEDGFFGLYRIMESQDFSKTPWILMILWLWKFVQFHQQVMHVRHILLIKCWSNGQTYTSFFWSMYWLQWMSCCFFATILVVILLVTMARNWSPCFDAVLWMKCFDRSAALSVVAVILSFSRSSVSFEQGPKKLVCLERHRFTGVLYTYIAGIRTIKMVLAALTEAHIARGCSSRSAQHSRCSTWRWGRLAGRFAVEALFTCT